MGEPEMDDIFTGEIPLSGSFPLPFRVLFLGGLGILGWATNLHGLHAAGIDGVSALDLQVPGQPLPLSSRSSVPHLGTASHPRVVYEPIYRLAVVYWAWCLACWMLFRVAAGGQLELADVFKYIPSIAMLGAFALLLAPFDSFRKRERDLFLLSVRRCLFPPSGRPIYFSDVILADIFTSFAKVFGDVWLSFCMLMPWGSLHVLPALQGWSRWILPTLMSLPYAIRLRQCLIEYGASSNHNNRRPLWNALKYATAFPVIYLSAAQRIVAYDMAEEKVAHDIAWNIEHRIFSYWLFFAAINSIFSFWWDVTNDWGLEFLSPRPHVEPKLITVPRPLVLAAKHDKSISLDRANSSSPSSSLSHSTPRSSTGTPRLGQRDSDPYPWGLRRILLYPLPVYPLLVFTNLVLRLTWSIKLSSHLHTNATAEGSLGILWLEVLELIRRWAWVFLRVEWEIVKRGEFMTQGMATRAGSRGSGIEMAGVSTGARTPSGLGLGLGMDMAAGSRGSGGERNGGNGEEYELVFTDEPEVDMDRVRLMS